MLACMLICVVLAALAGVVAARSVIAESDAHRLDLPDSWYGPVCAKCRGPLGVTMAACQRGRHRQRTMNVVILVVTIALSGLVPLALPSLWLVPAYLVFIWTMILLTVTDLDTKLIPNRILGPASIIGVVLLVGGSLAARDPGNLIDAGIGGVAYFAVMFLLAVIVPGGMGFGDVKMAFLIGIFAGYLGLGHVVVAGIGAFLLGGITAGFLLLTRRSGRKDAIPFGPFMTAAAIIAVIFGQAVVDWYLR